MTTLTPVPLKNLSRQVKVLTLCGLGMSVSSAETRDVAAFAALWVRVVRIRCRVVGDRRGCDRERDGEEEGAGGLRRRSPARSKRCGLASALERVEPGSHGHAPKQLRPRDTIGGAGRGDCGHKVPERRDSRPLWRSRKVISREAVSCERTFAVFEKAGVRARWPAIFRRSPSFARAITSASASTALSRSSGGSVGGAKG